MRFNSLFSLKTIKFGLLILLTLVLILIPNYSLAQSNQKAPIVVDGREIFIIGGLENFTANERAKIINESLQKELNSSLSSQLEIIETNQETVIRSKTSQRHLLTVTKNDVIEASSVFNQALIWEEKLTSALTNARLERTPAYLRQAWLYIIIVSVSAIALHVIFELIKITVNRQIIIISENNANFHPWQQQFQLLLKLTILAMQIGLWLAIFYYNTDLLPNFRSWRYTFFNFLSAPIFTLGKSEYSAIGLVLLLGFTIVIWFISKAITELFKAYLLQQTGVDPRAQEVIGILSQYVITFFSLIILWQLWGLDVASLTIVASVLGVGIGFGLQNITNDFISGVIITLERPIQLGDFVQVGELLGNVERIGARSTEIRTLDHVSIIVPNSRFLVNQVINWTHNDPISRIKIPVGVDYGSDVERVKMALLEAARSHPDVLLRPRPQVWFQEFADSAMKFELLVWTGEPKKQFILKSDLNYRIEEALRRHQLKVPFPQRDLHLRSPNLDLLITTLLQQYGVKPTENKVEKENKLEELSSFPEETNISFDTLNTGKIEQIMTLMRENVEIKERRYRLKNYDNCFISSEAIDWLMESQNWTREEAIEMGQMLIDRGIIKNITDNQNFEDGYYLYSFIDE
jgi:potassium-dependent mechanosensitive channel